MPAEFLDHATACNDCGMALVAREALAAPETAQAVHAFLGAQVAVAMAEAEAARDPAAIERAASLDIRVGVWVLLSCVVGFVLLNVMLAPTGFNLAPTGLCAYAVIRIGRGLEARRSLRPRA